MSKRPSDLTKEILLYTTLLLDYISYAFNHYLCLFFHYFFGYPAPSTPHIPTSTYHPAVLVTGTSLGLGCNIALTLACRGYTVFATVRRVEESDELTRQLSLCENEYRGNLIPLVADVSNKADVMKLHNTIRAVCRKKIPFVGLINNASQVIYLPSEVASETAFRESFETNFFAVVSLTKIFLPMLRESNGRVINVGSISAWHSTAAMGVYASSKAAIRTLSRIWRQELKGMGVDVVLVEPGAIKTRFTQQVQQNFRSFTSFPNMSRYHEIPQNVKSTVVQKYERQYRAIGRYCDDLFENASPPGLASDAILNALMAAYPKSIYYVGLDAKLLAAMNWILGERIVEAIQESVIGY
ncbi:2907_t:CDS:2 [Paraglomus occultum]|uniref:2907_t:CDS:1 n=1 Tax=Paraglomus occultum TaxID=144539 RepID=A0A9N9FGE9_9GLOM|nr:2907_t:CDS:2 [Paraglomus occultum]